MSQNDFNLANQGFPSMRSDMNSAFQALASNSSGATEPGTTYAYQWWYDETTDILKMRNADDDAWINIASFDQTNDTWSPYVGSTALTATGAELNLLDGVTATTAELNQLDGNTFTADITIPDKIIHAGDTNTSIRFPAADTVTVETAGSERVRVDSSGNVGIGTSSPISKLHVDQGTASITAASNNTALRVAYNFAQRTGDSYFMGVTDNGGSSNTGKLQFLNAGSTPLVTMQFNGNVGIGTSSPGEKLDVSGNVTISGSLSKGSGSFKIDHPIKPDTHHLVHSFIEGPQADNIYRGKVALVDGTATVNLDEAGRMTEGTFVALNGNVQCFTTNEDGWTAVRGKVDGNILTIEAQDATCTDTVSWLVIGERHDQHMIDANWTDEQGRIITEPEKETKQ